MPTEQPKKLWNTMQQLKKNTDTHTRIHPQKTCKRYCSMKNEYIEILDCLQLRMLCSPWSQRTQGCGGGGEVCKFHGDQLTQPTASG